MRQEFSPRQSCSSSRQTFVVFSFWAAPSALKALSGSFLASLRYDPFPVRPFSGPRFPLQFAYSGVYLRLTTLRRTPPAHFRCNRCRFPQFYFPVAHSGCLFLFWSMFSSLDSQRADVFSGVGSFNELLGIMRYFRYQGIQFKRVFP